MAVTADQRNTRIINTAACLIIGDEILGGKVDTFTMQLKKTAVLENILC